MSKIKVSEIIVSKIRVREIWVREIWVREIRVREIRVSEIRVSKIRVSEIRVREIRVSEIRISSNHRELRYFWASLQASWSLILVFCSLSRDCSTILIQSETKMNLLISGTLEISSLAQGKEVWIAQYDKWRMVWRTWFAQFFCCAMTDLTTSPNPPMISVVLAFPEEKTKQTGTSKHDWMFRARFVWHFSVNHFSSHGYSSATLVWCVVSLLAFFPPRFGIDGFLIHDRRMAVQFQQRNARF